VTVHDPAPLVLEEHTEAGVRRLRLTGNLDLTSAPVLIGTLDKMAAQRLDTIVLELEGIDFIDSYGLSAIVDSHRRLEAAGGRLRVGSLSDSARRLLDMTGLLEPLTQGDLNG
jgi:anti-anti-sigma factor